MATFKASAGQLRSRVRFERRRTSSDGMGNMESTWRTLISDVRARVVPQRGGEDVRASRLKGIENYDVVIWYSTDAASLTAGDRMVDERSGKTFNITWIGQDEQNRQIHLTCQSGGADG